MKHVLMMLICCLVPVGLIFLFGALGYSGFSGYLMLLCPLMHIAMMKMCMKKPGEPEEEKVIKS